MDANIEKRLKESEVRFNQLKEKRDQLLEQGKLLQRQISEIDQEQLRLQGDYRALKALMEEPKKNAKAKKK